MKSRWIIAISLIVTPYVLAVAGDAEYKKGEQWSYEVKGPRPWSDENIYGDRTISILNETESGWNAKEMWGTYDEQPYRYTVNEKGLVSKLEVGNNIVIEYDSPIPFQFVDLLKVDEEKDFGVYTQDADSWSLSLSTHVKRAADEDVTVPAGEFKGSQKYIVEQRLTFSNDQQERTRKMTRHVWVHPNVNGIVKETLKFQAMAPDAGDGLLESTSVLKEHIVKE